MNAPIIYSSMVFSELKVVQLSQWNFRTALSPVSVSPFAGNPPPPLQPQATTDLFFCLSEFASSGHFIETESYYM